MKSVFLSTIQLLLFYGLYAQQCPVNLDFESGNFSNWECFTGTTYYSGGINHIDLQPDVATRNRHEIISAFNNPGLDPYGKFPQLCPYGGNYSIKLGNNQTGNGAEGLSYTFRVPPTTDTFTFTYYYAVVFQDPGHTHAEQPRFFVTAYDVLTGALINCASYDYVAAGGIPGFKQSAAVGVLYKEWSPVSIQFAGLANRDVRLEFKTADCTRGGHFGYAYVDVGTNCSNILATAPYCIETNSIVLNAPYGFQTYTWYNEDYSAVIGNQQSLTLSPPPATSGIFHVDVIPYPGYGCRDTAEARVTPIPVPDTPVAQSDYFYCQFTNTVPLTATPLRGYDLLWYSAPAGGTGNPDAPIPGTTITGTNMFYVSQKELFGCESFRKPITVVINPTPAAIFSPDISRQCLTGNQFQFINTSTNLSNSIFTWDFGDGTIQSADTANASHTYSGYGAYNVKLKVLNLPSCSSEVSAKVTVVPKPVANFSYPPVICEQQTPVILSDQSTVQAGLSVINKWWWEVDGRITNTQNPASFIPAAAGKLPIKLVVTSAEGCISDTHSIITDIRNRPEALFNYQYPLCNNETIFFNNQSYIPDATITEFLAKWNWLVDDRITSTAKHPSVNLTTGQHKASLQVESNYGCQSLITDSIFEVHAAPEFVVTLNDSCVNVPIHHQLTDINNTVRTWYWDFGFGFNKGSSSTTKIYATAGNYPFTIIGETDNGCKDTLVRPFILFDNKSFAGNDTTVAKNQPVQLNANGGPNVTYLWSPATGLNDPSLENPVATSDKDQLYQLASISDKGCVSNSDIFIKRYAGPELYIPNAFTPNSNGKNDILRVIPIGIKKFISFTVYNRYGQKVFQTTDPHAGWDGCIKGMLQPTGGYVGIAIAIDYNGNKITNKETILLIR